MIVSFQRLCLYCEVLWGFSSCIERVVYFRDPLLPSCSSRRIWTESKFRNLTFIVTSSFVGISWDLPIGLILLKANSMANSFAPSNTPMFITIVSISKYTPGDFFTFPRKIYRKFVLPTYLEVLMEFEVYEVACVICWPNYWSICWPNYNTRYMLLIRVILCCSYEVYVVDTRYMLLIRGMYEAPLLKLPCCRNFMSV